MVTTAAGPGAYPEGGEAFEPAVVTDKLTMESGAWMATTPEAREDIRRRYTQYQLAQRDPTLDFDLDSGMAVPKGMVGILSGHEGEGLVAGLTSAATAVRNALAPPGRPQAPDEPVIRHDGHSPAETAATKWSERVGLPKHNSNRPSRTREGRRQAFLRDVAERDHISIEEADRLHPARPRARKNR